MKNILPLIFFLLCAFSSYPQYTVRVVVNKAPSKDTEDWYATGSFNNWNPADQKYKLKPFGVKRKAVVIRDLPPGKLELKITRGRWENVETNANGTDIENRLINVTADTMVYYDVAGWKDDYPDKPKPYTATAQVKVIDSAFALPQLNRTRRIWVYLPKGYETSNKNYPVLYMHDGQNLFSEHSAAFGEWGVDEALDTLQSVYKPAIIVGIDNGSEKRMNEYNPYNNERFGKAEGNEYVDFIVKTLKPHIDNKFRTLKDSSNTFIAGSSMGGLISLYALMKYPDVFGGAGIFSPSFWVAPLMFDDVATIEWRGPRKFYFYAGGQESETMLSDMDKMIDVIDNKGQTDIRRVVYPPGKHNEKTWRQEFPDFYKWLMKK